MELPIYALAQMFFVDIQVFLQAHASTSFANHAPGFDDSDFQNFMITMDLKEYIFAIRPILVQMEMKQSCLSIW